MEGFPIELAGRGRSRCTTADRRWKTCLAVGRSTGLEARQAMMTSLTSAGHSSGTLYMGRKGEYEYFAEQRML